MIRSCHLIGIVFTLLISGINCIALAEIDLSSYQIFSNLKYSEGNSFDFTLKDTQSQVNLLENNSNRVIETVESENNDIRKNLSMQLFLIDSSDNLFKSSSKDGDIKVKKKQSIAEYYNSTHCDESNDNEKFYYNPLKWFEINLRIF